MRGAAPFSVKELFFYTLLFFFISNWPLVINNYCQDS